MTTKEINRESRRIFEGLLLPSWAFRSQEDQEDYGVDGEIEITTSEDKATGFIFKLQLKGTSVANYDGSGQLVFPEASVNRFTYYISQLRIPLVFVVCNITSGECFWTRVQGNHQMESALNDAVAKDQKTFTIKFPQSRKILKTVESSGEIVEAVESALDAITLSGLQAISPTSVREHIRHVPDIEATEKQFRLITGTVASEAIQKMVRSGDFENASKKAGSLLESESEPPEVRLLGGLSLAHTYNALLRHEGAPDAAVKAAKVKFEIASRMLGISRQNGCETRMKRYVRIYIRAARMHINGRNAMALAVSEKAQTLQDEPISAPITHLHWLRVSALVAKDFFKLRDALYRLGAQGLFSVMPSALAEITQSIFPFVSALRLLGRGDLADAYVNALFNFLPICVGIVGRFDSRNDICEILTSLGIRFLGLADASDKASMPEFLKRFESILEDEPALECIDEIQAKLRQLANDFQATPETERKPTMVEVRSHIAQQAAELGIDLTNPNDDIAKVVRIGLEDLDPTRVARNCQHIHVMITSYGIPAEMLGLPTAGSKRIVCLKHGHSVENLSLDAAYKTFARTFPWTKDRICCENCPDKMPHHPKWEWTEEWNAQQYVKYHELVKRPDPQR